MPSKSAMELGRRNFLKLAGGAFVAANTRGAVAVTRPSVLPHAPAPADLASVMMEHSYTDLFNMPAFTNDWGYGQASKSVSGITGITFPPYACCGVPAVTWSPGLLSSCEIVLNGQLLSIAPPPGNHVLFQWLPQRVDRQQTVQGIRIRTRTFMPVKKRAVAERIEFTNTATVRRKLSLGFDLRAAVTKKTKEWLAGCPGEGENATNWDAEKSRLTFSASHSAASSAQGLQPGAQRLIGGHVLMYDLELKPGETRVFHYVNAIAETAADANSIYDHLQGTFDAASAENEQFYADMLRAVFTQNNSFFSGHLPTLHTDDEGLWNLYFAGIKNLLSARRSSPDSKYGPAYLTLAGHTLPTLSFPWDTSLTGLSLALLDPLQLRSMVEVWLQQDMHQHLATDYVSGKGVGPWYAVNDMAIVRCAREYLCVTGDFAWLQTRLAGKDVLEHLVDHALYWEKLQHTDRGLADYGKIENLLEVVSTYLHEVAGMNAGNVSSMRFVAELLDRRGDSSRANDLRARSRALAERINRLLYVSGKGWWRCGQLDGTFNEVRHCYDYLSVAQNMAEDLSPQQKLEMNNFFWSQLRSRKWMRALASGDTDATWNIRPDHSCLGAYASWPPMSAKALYRLGMPASQIAGWLREVSMAGNQGPIGQAHFTEDVFPPEHGGAFKCPNDPPYLNEWSCIAGGAFSDLVIDTLFGADPGLDAMSAKPCLTGFDPRAELRGLRYRDKQFVVNATGVRPL
jgi:hypothetical protein